MYTGQLEGFPQEIVEKMLEEQVRQGNKRDVTVFEKNIFASKRNNGFDHGTAVFENWYKVKEHRDFDLFYAKYPKKDKTFPRIMMVSDDPSFSESSKRVVEFEKNGKFFAWGEVETIEEAKNSMYINTWKYAKEIEEKEEITELTLEDIAKLVNRPVTSIKIVK